MMEQKVVIIDTSILCVWLKVPGKETCGTNNDRWDYDRASAKIEEEVNAGSLLVLPMTTIIESGNHIAQSAGNKHELVNRFADLIEATISGTTPWTEFGQMSSLMSGDALRRMLGKWRGTAIAGQSLGDALIVEIADYYSAIGAKVEILTGDGGLKAYEPVVKQFMIPRRRR